MPDSTRRAIRVVPGHERMKITFLIPVYNERETLEPLVEGISENAAPHEHRILLVDDGSTDGSYEVMKTLRKRFPTVDIIKFRVNLGKSAALAAGFPRAAGDLVFTMDGDLQDDPKEIPRFIEKLDEGYDVVCGWKKVRHDPWHKTFPSKIYNWFIRRLFKLNVHDINCGFKLFRMEVVKRIQVYGDMHRLIPVFAAHLGYRIAEIPVTHHPRRYGRSKYGPERFSRGVIDVLTTLFLSSHRDSPGHFFGRCGFLAMVLGLLAMLAAVLMWLAAASAVGSIALWMLGIGLLLAGTGCVALGLVAESVISVHPPLDPDLYIEEKHLG